MGPEENGQMLEWKCTIKPGSTFLEAKEQIFNEALVMQNLIDIRLAKFQQQFLKPGLNYESFLKECRASVWEDKFAIDTLHDKLGVPLDKILDTNHDEAIVVYTSQVYKQLVDRLATKSHQIEKQVKAQRELDLKQRQVAAHLSTEEVLEGFVDTRVQAHLRSQSKSKGRSKGNDSSTTGLDYASMLKQEKNEDGSRFVALEGDLPFAEQQERALSKSRLAELKKLKHEMRLLKSKNYKSPGGVQGHNQNAEKKEKVPSVSPKAKPKAKARAKPTPPPTTDKGKGKGSGKLAAKGKGKGSKGSGKGRGKARK